MASELADYILSMCLSWLVAKMRVGDAAPVGNNARAPLPARGAWDHQSSSSST
jgi:hypothetical protein